MPTRYDSAGRIQPIESRNLAIPAECLLCKRIGKHPDEIFADLRVELGFYGDCYLCQDCCHEVAAFVMAVSFERHEHVKEDLWRTAVEVTRLMEQVKYLRGLLDARIDSAGSSEPDRNGSVSVSLPAAEPESINIDSNFNPNQSVTS